MKYTLQQKGMSPKTILVLLMDRKISYTAIFMILFVLQILMNVPVKLQKWRPLYFVRASIKYCVNSDHTVVNERKSSYIVIMMILFALQILMNVPVDRAKMAANALTWSTNIAVIVQLDTPETNVNQVSELHSNVYQCYTSMFFECIS